MLRHINVSYLVDLTNECWLIWNIRSEHSKETIISFSRVSSGGKTNVYQIALMMMLWASMSKKPLGCLATTRPCQRIEWSHPNDIISHLHLESIFSAFECTHHQKSINLEVVYCLHITTYILQVLIQQWMNFIAYTCTHLHTH